MMALRRGRALIWTSAVVLLPLAVAWGEGGVFEEGDSFVLRTGGTEPLLTLDFPLTVPGWERAPRLEFAFGFATAEPFAAQTFFDSFSASVERVGTTLAALLFTVDRGETVWGPSNPGGLFVQLLDLLYAEVAFADLAPEFDLTCAYSVSYTLPPELAGRPVRLLFDLFDNGNEFQSMACVTGVRVVSIPDPPRAPILQWAGFVDGPYEALAGVRVDLVRRELRLALPWGTRFFRLNAPVPTRILGVDQRGMTASLRYTVEPPLFEVESSAVADGAYVTEPNVVRDYDRQRVIVANPGGARFYRIRSTVAAEITGITVAGDSLVLGFAFPGVIPFLETASEIDGPYRPEPDARATFKSQTVSWPVVGRSGFFRIQSDRQTRITSVRIQEETLTLTYE